MNFHSSQFSNEKNPVYGRDKLKLSSDIGVFWIPFKSFYSRVRSSSGRISQEISYPVAVQTEYEPPEVEARVIQRKKNWILTIKENRTEKNSPVYDYQVLLYIADGKGRRVDVPPFRSETEVNLGQLHPCLCYLTGIREIGAVFEQYVGWIGEERALSLDGELDQYLDPDF